ncbi:hypothetical protein B0A48_02418 [Cryoendolithus antarcticus]|uniref:Uncharacterized protein n=1 Tax=Cryoendolithus antarcticus TaxID=1507870 RepID=A0A1V8TNS3_9PEZI|nr:hypothetical protein B0A48_02418 [Cryoendolithus antarcticus]
MLALQGRASSSPPSAFIPHSLPPLLIINLTLINTYPPPSTMTTPSKANTTKPLPPPPASMFDPKLKTPFSSPLSTSPDSSRKTQSSEGSPAKSVKSVDKPLPPPPTEDSKVTLPQLPPFSPIRDAAAAASSTLPLPPFQQPDIQPPKTSSSLPHSTATPTSSNIVIPARPPTAIAKELFDALENLYNQNPLAFWEGLKAHNLEAEIKFDRVMITGKFPPPIEWQPMREFIGGRPPSGDEEGSEKGVGRHNFRDYFKGQERVKEWVGASGDGENGAGGAVGGVGGAMGAGEGGRRVSDGSTEKGKTLRRLKGILRGKGGAAK